MAIIEVGSYVAILNTGSDVNTGQLIAVNASSGIVFNVY